MNDVLDEGMQLSRVEVDRLFAADVVEVTENEIRIRLRPPGAFNKAHGFKSQKVKGIEGVRAIVGRLKGKTVATWQALRFDRSKWTRGRAVTWAKKHGFKG